MKLLVYLHDYLGACGGRLYETVIPTTVICVIVVTSSCLRVNKPYSTGLLAPSSYCNCSTMTPPNILDRNHGSRLGVVSSCCNYSTANPPNFPERDHGSPLEVMLDGKRWSHSAVHVPTQTESQGRRLIVTCMPYVNIPTAYPDYERRSRRRIACCSSRRDKQSLPRPPLLRRQTLTFGYFV